MGNSVNRHNLFKDEENPECPLKKQCKKKECTWDHDKMIFKECRLGKKCNGVTCCDGNHITILNPEIKSETKK